MVKAELIIEFQKDDRLHIGLDLLKREDWNETEWDLANHLQETLLILIEVLKQAGATEIKREIIK